MPSRIIDRHSVQTDVALVAPRSVHRAVPRVNVHVNVRAVPGVKHSCLQTQEIGHVTPFHGKLLHLVLVERDPQGRVRRVQGDCLGGHLYRLGGNPDF